MQKPASDHIPKYSQKKGKVITHFEQKPFRSQFHHHTEDVRDALIEIQRQVLMNEIYSKGDT